MTYIHPLRISDLIGVNLDIHAQWSQKTREIQVISSPFVAMHMTETEH